MSEPDEFAFVKDLTPEQAEDLLMRLDLLDEAEAITRDTALEDDE